MRLLHMLVTAYCLTGTTASGAHTGPGTVAVDPRVVHMGAHLRIPGYGRAVARDTGGAIKGYRLDVWFPTCWQARRWGARRLTVAVGR